MVISIGTYCMTSVVMNKEFLSSVVFGAAIIPLEYTKKQKTFLEKNILLILNKSAHWTFFPEHASVQRSRTDTTLPGPTAPCGCIETSHSQSFPSSTTWSIPSTRITSFSRFDVRSNDSSQSTTTSTSPSSSTTHGIPPILSKLQSPSPSHSFLSPSLPSTSTPSTF